MPGATGIQFAAAPEFKTEDAACGAELTHGHPARARFEGLLNESEHAVALPRAPLARPDLASALLAMTQYAQATPLQAPPASTSAAKFAELLQSACSALYVDEQSSSASSHMLLALDAALPGAAVEFVRDGVFLRVRLHARNDTAFRLMSANCDSLQTVLGDVTHLNISVDVIRDEGASHGRTG